MEEERDRLLDDPTGGPAAGTKSAPEDKGDAAVDPSAGAAGQDEGKGAMEEAADTTGEAKPTPG